MKTNFVKKPAPFAVGDLVRDLSDSSANTVYRVLYVRPEKNPTEWRQWQITVKPVFGLFKSDYKRNKNIAHTGRRHTEETKRKCRDAVRRRRPEQHPHDCTCGKHFTGLKRRLLTSQDVQNACAWYDAGKTWKQIAHQLGVSNSALVRAVRRHGDQTRVVTSKKPIQPSSRRSLVGSTRE